MHKISLTKKVMNEIQNQLNENMINLYHKVLWKPKVGDPVSELSYPELGGSHRNKSTLKQDICRSLSTSHSSSTLWASSTTDRTQ